jgi:ketosteroid isomerase-like protein
MSQENVEVVRAAILALNRKDVETMLELFDPAVQLNSVLSPLEGTFQGHVGVRSYLATIFGGEFEGASFEIERIIEGDDDQVLAGVRARGRGVASGVAIDQVFWSVFKIQNGKVIKSDSYERESDALEALGLRE